MTKTSTFTFRVHESLANDFYSFRDKIKTNKDSELLRVLLHLGITSAEYLHSTGKWQFNHVRLKKAIAGLSDDDRKYLLSELQRGLFT